MYLCSDLLCEFEDPIIVEQLLDNADPAGGTNGTQWSSGSSRSFSGQIHYTAVRLQGTICLLFLC